MMTHLGMAFDSWHIEAKTILKDIYQSYPSEVCVCFNICFEIRWDNLMKTTQNELDADSYIWKIYV